MKSIVEYACVRQQLLQLNEMSLTDGDLIVESTFLSRFANWIGGKGKSILDRFKEYKNDFKNFDVNVRNAFNGFVANANNEKDKLPEDKRKDLIDKVAANNLEDIPKAVVDIINSYSKDPDFKQSATAAYLCALGINIAKAKGNTAAEEELRKFFAEVPADVKKEANDNLKQELENNKKETEGEGDGQQQSQETPQQETPSQETPTEDTQKVADNVIEDPAIKQAADKMNIELKHLKDTISYTINSLNPDGELDMNEMEDLAFAIAEIIIGAKTIDQNDKINNDILNKYKIGNLEEFIKLIEEKK